MKKLAVVLFVGLFVLAGAKASSGEQEQEVTFFDMHHQGWEKAFAAASAWSQRTFPGKSAAFRSSNQYSGTIIIKAAYRMRSADPSQTRSQDGLVPYTLTVKVGSERIMMSFLTGDGSRNIDTYPAQARQQLSLLYRTLRGSLVKAVADYRGHP
jgi:hypothetical protein